MNSTACNSNQKWNSDKCQSSVKRIVRAINSNGKIVRSNMDCSILYTFLLVIILLFIIAVIWYHYTKHRSKQTKNNAE